MNQAQAPRTAPHRFLLIMLLLSVLAATMVAQPSPAVVVRSVGVVDVEAGTVAPRTVVVRGDRVAEVLAAAEPGPAGALVVDGQGRYLIPGLWDMHVHLATRPEPRLAEDIALPLLLTHGVVGARDMGGPLERVTALRDGQARGAIAGPRLLVAGPFIDGPGDDDPSFVRVAGAVDARAAVDRLADAGVDFIKLQAALSADAHDAAVETATARRLRVAGHVPVAMTVDQVIASGQRSIEHVSAALVSDGAILFACSSRDADLHAELQAIERDRGAADAATIRAREIALRRALVETYDPARARALGARLREHGVWLVPTLVWSGRVRPVAADDTGEDTPLEYVPAATRARWRQARRDYLAAIAPTDLDLNARVAAAAGRAVADLHRGGVRVMAGTDAFDGFVIPGVSLHEELARLVRAGLTPLDALRAATSVPAAYRGAAAGEGRIAPGAVADLVLLDADPLADVVNVSRIAAVVRRGRVYSRSDLDALLAGARAAAAKE